jgi:branched-chain amino acid transport system substrate-binding protein
LAAERLGPAIRLSFRDTRGDPATAVGHVDSAARDPRTLALVGPVLAEESLAAAGRAADLGLPLLALSPVEGLTARGPTVFRSFLSAGRQARAIARYATEELRLARFAVLHPRTAYGETLRDRFREEVSRRGGRVVATAGYPRGEATFAREVRALRAHRFQALFLPDGLRTAALAASHLAAAGLTGPRAARLLGTNEWNAADLRRHTGPWLEGAIFPAAFLPGSGPEAQAFARRSARRFGTPPTYVEAYAFDAVRLVHTALRRAGRRDRAAFVDALRSARVEGVTGPLEIDGKRELAGPLALVEVAGRGLRFLPGSGQR